MKEKIFFRECPNCKKQIGHTNRKNCNSGQKKNRFCGKCRAKEVNFRPETISRRKLLGEKYKISLIGKNNPFYGKRHNEDTKEKLRNMDRSFTQTKEFKDKCAKKGNENGMYGKSVYDVWLKKYGEQEANKRMLSLKDKLSKALSGQNNPMYGKVPPVGSGNGWSGWYKNWYFRSLRELSYMIQVIEKKNYKWRSAETGDLGMKYIDIDGTERTYKADFLVNESILIEIKPKKLMETVNNILKKKAAIVFCKQSGYKYRMIDVKILDIKKIIDLYKNSLIVFTDKYKQKLEKIICKLER